MVAWARDEALLEAMIDATLADSFPPSDPPSWTLGRDRYRTEPSKINEKEIPASPRPGQNVTSLILTTYSDLLTVAVVWPRACSSYL